MLNWINSSFIRWPYLYGICTKHWVKEPPSHRPCRPWPSLCPASRWVKRPSSAAFRAPWHRWKPTGDRAEKVDFSPWFLGLATCWNIFCTRVFWFLFFDVRFWKGPSTFEMSIESWSFATTFLQSNETVRDSSPGNESHAPKFQQPSLPPKKGISWKIIQAGWVY